MKKMPQLDMGDGIETKSEFITLENFETLSLSLTDLFNFFCIMRNYINWLLTGSCGCLKSLTKKKKIRAFIILY